MSALAASTFPAQEFQDDVTRGHANAARQLRRDGKHDEAIRRYEEAIEVRDEHTAKKENCGGTLNERTVVLE
jgi:hypothetical protein